MTDTTIPNNPEPPAEDGPVTATPRAETAAAPRRLLRSQDDRMVGGVAAGVASFFELDPLLVRIAFVLLAIFGGGSGVLLYLLAWLVVPTADQDAYVSRGRAGVMVLALLGATLLIASLLFASPMFGHFDGPPVLLALALLGVGFLLFRQDTRRASAEALPPAVPAAGPAAASAAPPRPARPARPRSILGRITLAVSLLGVGLLAVLDNAGGVDAEPNHYLGLVLTCLGAGLVVGAWRGRAYWLVLVGLVLLPPTLASSLAATYGVSIRDGFGERRYEIDDAAELDRAVTHGGGYVQLILHDLDLSQDEQLDASLGFGQMEIVVPEDLRVAVEGSVQAGNASLFGRDIDRARDEEITFTLPPQGGREGDPVLTLDLEVGFGQIILVRDGEPLSIAPDIWTYSGSYPMTRDWMEL